MTTKTNIARKARRRNAVSLAACCLAVLAFAGLWIWLEPPAGRQAKGRVGGPFTLVADDGHVVTDQSFAGKYLIGYFGYTACHDVCRVTLHPLAAAMDRLGAKVALVQPLFITLDPGRDNPAVLHRFVKAFTPTLIGLTSSPAELHRTADEYRMVSVLHQDDAGYALDHGSVLFLMSPGGRLVRPVRADASEVFIARAVAQEL